MATPQPKIQFRVSDGSVSMHFEPWDIQDFHNREMPEVTDFSFFKDLNMKNEKAVQNYLRHILGRWAYPDEYFAWCDQMARAKR